MQTHHILTLRYLAGLLTLVLCSNQLLADTIELPLTQASSGNFYLHAELSEGVETDLLLDTGSGYLSLSKSTFDRIKTKQQTTFSRNIYGKMANGRVMEVPVYLLASIQLSENCILRNIEAAVFPNADRDILGLNVLSHLQPFTMQMTPPLLTGAQCH